MRARGLAVLASAVALLTTVAAAAEEVRLEGNGVLRLAKILALPDDDGFECIISEEYSLAGLRPGEPLAALGRLGPPKRLTSGYGEDDGGGYTIHAYGYDGLAVEIVRGEIDVIEATDARWPTPSGIRVGMTRGDAIAAFGRRPGTDYATATGYSFPGCPSADGAWNESLYFELIFGADSRLARIRFITDRP